MRCSRIGKSSRTLATSRCAIGEDNDLNRIPPAVELVVFVESALAGAEARERLDEQYRLHPLHLFEAQLELVAQANRRTVLLWQQLTIHLVGENGLRVVHARDFVNVVEQTAARVRTVREREEDSKSCLRLRTNHLHDVLHRRTAPLGNAGPTLNTVMLRDLLVLRHAPEIRKRDLHRVLDQPADLQFVVGKSSG